MGALDWWFGGLNGCQFSGLPDLWSAVCFLGTLSPFFGRHQDGAPFWLVFKGEPKYVFPFRRQTPIYKTSVEEMLYPRWGLLLLKTPIRFGFVDGKTNGKPPFRP